MYEDQASQKSTVLAYQQKTNHYHIARKEPRFGDWLILNKAQVKNIEGVRIKKKPDCLERQTFASTSKGVFV